MPVDPYIFATSDGSLAPGLLPDLSVDLAEAVQVMEFFNFDNIGIISRVSIEDYPSLPDGLPHSEIIVRIRPVMAYYGQEYERGYWPEIAAVFEFLRRRLPSYKVWYGRDDGDWVKELTPEAYDAHWAHWVTYGNRPYLEWRAQINTKRKPPLPISGSGVPVLRTQDSLPEPGSSGGY